MTAPRLIEERARADRPVLHVIGLALVFLSPGLLVSGLIEWGSSTGDDRFQARSRLDQAMTVAQKRIEAGKQIATTRRPDANSSEWAAAREDAKEEEPPVDESTPHVVVDQTGCRSHPWSDAGCAGGRLRTRAPLGC